MGYRTLLNYPNELGFSRVNYDPDTDTITTHQMQDVEPILEANKKDYREGGGRYKNEIFNKVASIPFTTILQWKKEGLDIFDNSPETKRKLRQKLNDPEYRYLRTRPGRI